MLSVIAMYTLAVEGHVALNTLAESVARLAALPVNLAREQSARCGLGR